MTSRSSPHRRRRLSTEELLQSDGPTMILLLFGLAMLIGLLVGFGAHRWSQQYQDRPGDIGPPLSNEAAGLGYHSERDFSADRSRAAVALHQVLASSSEAQHLWENVETGNRGLLWGAASFVGQDGLTCRPLERRTLVNKAFRDASAVICRDVHGDWPASVAWQGK